jgi:hypothetical protein
LNSGSGFGLVNNFKICNSERALNFCEDMREVPTKDPFLLYSEHLLDRIQELQRSAEISQRAEETYETLFSQIPPRDKLRGQIKNLLSRASGLNVGNGLLKLVYGGISLTDLNIPEIIEGLKNYGVDVLVGPEEDTDMPEEILFVKA